MYQRCLITLFLLLALPSPVSSAAIDEPNPYAAAAASPSGAIDQLVFSRLQRLKIEPARLCSDAAFVRRVYFDVIGTLPTGYEAREFILSKDPQKRRALIDRLIEREEFADYWAMKWCDVLRVKAEFPINLWPNAVQSYHRWIRTSIKENLSYDRFARELLTANGSNFRVPPVNFYRAMQNREPSGIAQAVALTFMGQRADKWPKERVEGMAGFFSKIGYKSTQEWKEEIILFDQNSTNKSAPPVFPDGTPARFGADTDPRVAFADWLVTPKNPWFTRNIANRVWAWLLGRGIIHEADDIRPDNPPSNPELLAHLERELISNGYDLKQLYRLILNSQTYQLASIPGTDTPEAAANFASYPVRRIEAEVLIDALNQITGTTEKYSSPIPEPFTFIPDAQRSITLADASITSSFLELFGRSPRDTGIESERNNKPSAAQRLHLLNSSHVLKKIEQSRMIQYQTQPGKGPRDMAIGLYLGILSRFPTETELKVIESYPQASGVKGREAAVDLAWALINTSEFLYRH